MTQITHAVVRPVSQCMRTGEWETAITTLCGLPPGEVSSFSLYPRFVSCVLCRASDYFVLLTDERVW